MADQPRSKIIKDNPIRNGLDAFRTSFGSVCEGASVSCTPDALEQLGHEDLQNLTLDLLSALQSLRASRLLRSISSGKDLFSDLSRLNSTVNSDEFDLDRIKPLLPSAIDGGLDDSLIWEQVYNAITESTPPLRPIASSLQQTPWLPNTMTAGGERFIKIEQNGSAEHFIIDEVMQRARCICWKAYREAHPQIPLVIKDSWQRPERDEGELLREVTSIQPKVIAVGTTCYVTTMDNKTVLKGHQVWFGGNLVFDYEVPCEERLAREATIYKHLGRHPHILTCFGLEEVHPGIHSLRLEMAPLGCIRAYIQKNANSPPPIQRRLQMALDVATGLSYMHSRGAMSCDLSSAANLFVFDDLRVKLGDFGGALLEGFDFEWDQTHESRYRLPSRGREYDDVPLMKRELFGLGSAIYEITAWGRPFPELNDDEVDDRYARGEFPPLDSNPVGHIISNCWAEAYATAQEAAHDLKASKASMEEELVSSASEQIL